MEEQYEEPDIEQEEALEECLQDYHAPVFHKVKELADELYCSSSWITQLLRDKRIKGIPLGAHWRIPHEEYEKILREGIPPIPEKKPSPIHKIYVNEDIPHKTMGSQYEPPEGRHWPITFEL